MNNSIFLLFGPRLFLFLAFNFSLLIISLNGQVEVEALSPDTAYLAEGGNMGYFSLNATGTGFRAQNTAQSAFVASESGGTSFSSFSSQQRGFFAATPLSHGFHSLTAGTYGFFADNSIEAGFVCDNSNGDSFRAIDSHGHGFLSQDAGFNGFRAERPASTGFVVEDAGSAGFSTVGSNAYGYYNHGSNNDGYYSVNAGASGFRSSNSVSSGFSSSGSGAHGVNVLNSVVHGLRSEGAGASGVLSINSQGDGIQSVGALQRAGFFVNDAFSNATTAVYMGHGDNTKYDLQLNRTGRIASEKSMVLYLGTDGDGGQLIIRNDADQTVATISQNGNANFTGNISKGGGTFKIDHPLVPTEKYLSHSFVESPDMMNIYNGIIVTDDNGLATVELPDYFEALNMEFRYQLTVLGTFAYAIIKEEIVNNKFLIQSDQPSTKVSWQVSGIRQDPYAMKHRVEVESEKPMELKGTYLHPEAWAKEMGVAKLPSELADKNLE